MHSLTASTITPPPPSSVFKSGCHAKWQRGEKIRQFVLKATQENRSITRQQLQASLKKELGISVTISRLNYQLRNLGIREITQWSDPGTGARTKKPSAHVTHVRELLRHAVTNGQRRCGTVELSELLLREHNIPLVPENLRRHLSAMGFRWMAGDDGFGWGVAGPDFNSRKKHSARVTSSEATIARQIIEQQPVEHKTDNARHVCEYVKARRSKWIAEHGPCKCGSSENLVVYNPGRERIFWTYSDERLLPLLATASVACASCMRANINKRRARTSEEKQKIKDGVKAHFTRLRAQSIITEVAVAREIKLVQQLEKAQAAVERHNKRLEDAKLKKQAQREEREERQALRLIEQRRLKQERLNARRGTLMSVFIEQECAENPESRKRMGPVKAAIGHLYSGEIKTKQIREYQRSVFKTKGRSGYSWTLTVLKRVLKRAGILERISFLKLKIGRHLTGKKFIRQYMQKASCVECGRRKCGCAKVLRAKDGKPMRSSGLANLPVETITRRLKEVLEVVCQSCQGKAVSRERGEDVSDDEIKDALQSFEQPGHIVKRLRTDLKRVHRLSEELFEIGVTCICEKRRLGHGECKELKMIRSSPDYVAPGQKPQTSVSVSVVIPVDVYDDDRCQGSRSCPFPVASQGLCCQHLAMQQLTESMEGNTLDLSDYTVTDFNPSPLLSAVKVEELRNPHLKTISPSGRWQNTRSM